MGDRRYWIDVFTPRTWLEFLAAGGVVSGFPHRARKTVSDIAVGDWLVCYVAGISRWIAVLEVVGTHFTDDSRDLGRWRLPGTRPCEGGRCSHAGDGGASGRPAGRHADVRQFAEPRTRWSIFFRASPRKMNGPDAGVVVAALMDAKVNPIGRPLPPRYSGDTTDSPGTSEDSDQETAFTPELPEDVAEQSTAVAGSDHTEIQWLLLKLGSDMGLSVWAPMNDRGREWEGHKPGDVPHLLDDLPHQFDDQTTRTIKAIDVLWLERSTIVAAFEVENTTSIYSGLLRMSDLLAMQPNLSIPLFIAAPDSRRPRVFREVNRPTFDRRTHRSGMSASTCRTRVSGRPTPRPARLRSS